MIGRLPGTRAQGPPSGGTALWLLLGVLAVSTSAPLIRVAAAPPLAVAFWRNVFALLVLAPVALGRSGRDLLELGRRELAMCALAGVALAAHFAVWVTSVTLTTVASSTALVATQPLFVAVAGAVLLHERIGRGGRVGIGVAMLGVVVLAGADVRLSGQALRGDVLALAGAVFVAAYLLLGRVVRPRVPLLAYVVCVYSVAAVLLGVAALAHGDPLGGFRAAQWLALAACGLGPQVLGHTVFNFLLRRLRADAVAVATLGEPVGASLIALVALGEAPPRAALPGGALVLAGIWLTVRDAAAQRALVAARAP